MAAPSDSIEPSTIKYVFEMFGKSVTQMLQASLDQQAAIDEIRSQIRTVQTQITNITSSMDEFENRIFVKVQEIRPTIYTRDGIPLDDALEVVQSKILSTTDKSQQHTESIQKLESELKTKVDTEVFETAIRENDNSSTSFSEMSVAIQNVQNELQKQRQESDALNDRIMQMVNLRLEQQSIKNQMAAPTGDEIMTKSMFDAEIAKLRAAAGQSSQEPNPFEKALANATPDNIAAAFAFLQDQQQRLESVYEDQKDKLSSKYQKLLQMTGEEEDNGEFTVEDGPLLKTAAGEEREYRNVEIDAEGNVDGETPFTRKTEAPVQHRSIGLCATPEAISSPDSATPKSPKAKILLEMKKLKGKQAGGQAASVDEARISSNIAGSVMGKVEAMMVDFLSLQGIGGVKLDRNDAKAIVQELSIVQKVKEEIQKLKLQVKMKMDAVTAEQELDIRLKKDDFFQYLSTIFPNNQNIQRLLASFQKKLPSLKTTTAPKQDSKDDVRATTSLQKRPAKTAQAPNLVPARNSKLLALNQKFLKGADGRYYLRDLTSEMIAGNSISVAGVTRAQTSITADQAFDFQPFLPASSIKMQNDGEKASVNPEHRAKTPPESSI